MREARDAWHESTLPASETPFADRYAVLSIPTVVVFRDGKPVIGSVIVLPTVLITNTSGNRAAI